MAEEDEGGGRHPSTGGGRDTGSSGRSPFLRKLGPLPVWAWMLVLLGVAIAYYSWHKNKASQAAAATQQPNAAAASAGGSQTPPFVIQNYTTGPGTNPTGTGGVGNQGGKNPGQSDQYNNQGRDLGQYLYGSKQLEYISQNIGSYGFTQSLYSDVQNAFAAVSQKYSPAIAEGYHYSWIGPGNVQAIPKDTLSQSQILQNLP